MARNWEKYMYVELAIPRNSAWFPLLEAEAAAKGQPLAQVTLEKLAASYLRGNLAASASLSNKLNHLSPAQQSQLVDSEFADDIEPQLSEEQAAHNAASFLDNGGLL
ncbi:MAG TPA: hypothetical protein VGD98_20355 [Ktedonobacteraceae bacterium]